MSLFVTATTNRCHHYARGFCPFGRLCPYVHPDGNKTDWVPDADDVAQIPIFQNIEKLPYFQREILYDKVQGEVTARLSGMTVSFGGGAKVTWFTHRLAALEQDYDVYTGHAAALSFKIQRPRPYVNLVYETLEAATKAFKAFRIITEDNRALLCEIIEHGPGQFVNLKVSNLSVGRAWNYQAILHSNQAFADFSKDVGAPCITALTTQPPPIDSKTAVTKITSLLAREGLRELPFLDTLFIPFNGVTEVFALLRTETEAHDASIALHGYEFPELGFAKCQVRRVKCTGVRMPAHVFAASRQILIEQDKRLRDPLSKVWPYFLPKGQKVKMLLFSDSNEESRKERQITTEAIRATVLQMHGKPLWHPFLGTQEGLEFLEHISNNIGGGIFACSDTQSVRGYGTTEERRALFGAVWDQIKDLNEPTYTYSLQPKLYDWALRGGLQRLKDELGKDNVSVSYKTEPPTLICSTVTLPLEELIQSVLQGRGNPNDTEMTDGKDCTICFCEALEPLITSCGHSYCVPCFAGLCRNAPDRGPEVQCLEEDCGKVLELMEIRDFLGVIEFENLLESQFKSYVKANPKLRNCPTPDCKEVYRTNRQYPKITCGTCLAEICMKCLTLGHPDKTCADNLLAVAQQEADLAKWKLAHDAKDCPRCKIGIERIEGCDHVKCENCRIHICWICLQTFESDLQTYDHLSLAHPGETAEQEGGEAEQDVEL